MPPRLVQQDDAVISTAADIKQKVEQLQLRLQHCVQSLELVSSSTESQGTSQPAPHQHQARPQVAGNLRYPGASGSKASQKSPTGTEHSTAGRDSRDVSLQNGHDRSHDGGSPMRPSMNGLPPGDSVGVTASDEGDWEEAVLGDDASVEFGTGEFEQLRVHSASSGRQRYTVGGDAPNPAPPQSAVSVGAALQALKQNLSPHVQSSLQGANVPTHGEQLRVQYKKAVGDSVQRRLVGRADAYHSSGNLDLSGVDLDAAAGYLRSGSLPNPQLASQGSETAPNKLASTSTSQTGMARPSLLGIGNDSQHHASRLARQASAAGVRTAEEGLTSPVSSRRESMDPQRPAKSKIPGPPGPASSVGGGTQAGSHAPEGGSGPEAIHRRGPPLVMFTEAEQPRPSASASRDFGNGGGEMLLQRSLPSPVSAVGSARGWRFVAEESGGTVLVSIGSGAVDEDDETITPTTQGPRPPSGLLPSPFESVTSLPPAAGAGDAPAVVGFVLPPEALASVQSSGSEVPVRGFTPPAAALPQTPAPVVGFVPPHHVTGQGALVTPVIGFVPPWEASSPRPGSVAGFVPPSGLQAAAGVGWEGKGPTAAEPTVGFVPPATLNAADASGSSPRPSTSAPHNGRPARASLLPSASMVPMGDFSFGIQAHVFSNTTKLSLRSSVSSNSGVGVRPDLPKKEPSDSAANSASGPQQASWIAASGHSVTGAGRVGDEEQGRSYGPGSEGLSLQSSAVSKPPTTDGEEEGKDLEPGFKLPWEESSDEGEGDAEAAGRAPSAQGGLDAGSLEAASTAQPEPEPTASASRAAAQGPAQGMANGAAVKGRLPPPSLASSSPRGSEGGGQLHAVGGAGGDRAELLTAPALDAFRSAPSFSDHSRVASPAIRSTAGPAAQPVNSTATVMSRPSLSQPAPLDPARAPSPGPAPPRSPYRSPPHSPLRGPQSAPLPQRTSNSGVSITISDADIARAGGMVPALLELVRERFRQKGVCNLAQLAAGGLGHFADGGTAPSSPALGGETLAERIAARVEVFQSRRSSGGLVAALSSGTDQDDGNGRLGVEDSFASSSHATARPLSKLSSIERAGGATPSSAPPLRLHPQPLSPVANAAPVPSAMATAGAATTPRAVASTGSWRGSNSSIPLPAPPETSTVATATTLPPSPSGPHNTAGSRIPGPGQGQVQAGASAAAYNHRAVARSSSTNSSPTVAQGVAFASGGVESISSTHRLSATSRASASQSPSPSRSPEAAPPAPVSARAEQGTQTPPLLQPQPSVEEESSSVQLGTAREFFLSTTVPLASARSGAGSCRISNAAAIAADKLLPPEMPTICTAADFFRGAASRATINTSAMAVLLRDLPAGAAVASPFLTAADPSVSSPHSRVRTARDLLSFNGAPVRPRRQSASGRGVVSTGGLVGRPASAGCRISNGGGGRVVIDDEPIDLASTYPSSRTLSYYNRRASAGASTRVAFDDDHDTAPPAGPVPAGGATSSGRALTREILMHLAHLPSEPRNAFETTTDEERGEQERQAMRRARQRRASGVSDGQGLAVRPQRVSYGGAGPISSRQSQSTRTAAPEAPDSLQPWSSDPSAGAGGYAGRQSHQQHHAHFEPAAVGDGSGPAGRSALPRQLVLVVAGAEDRDGAASTESPAIAAAPGDAIPVPPLSLDAPDMPDPCGGDPAACARSRPGAQLPHDRFFTPQSPTWDRQGPGAGGATEPAAGAGVPGRRNRHPAAAGERGGPAGLSRFSLAAQGGGGVATADVTAPSSRRRRSLTAATNTDSWATGSSDDDSSTDGRDAAAPGRPFRGGAAAGAGGSSSRRNDPKESRPRIVVPTVSGPSASLRASGDAPAVRWSSRRRGTSWSDAEEEEEKDDAEVRELVSMPSDRTEDTETTLDLLERIPSTLSASRCALSPSSAAVSVLSQRRYVAAARAHRSVSEANSTKRLSGGAPLLTEEEEGDEDSEEGVPLRAGDPDGAPVGPTRLSRRGSSGEVQAGAVELARRGRGERRAAEAEGPVGAGGLAKARDMAGGRGGLSGRSRSRSRAGEGEDVRRLAAARREPERGDDQGAASAGSSTPHGVRTRQSPLRLLDTRVSPVPAVLNPSRARTADGETCDSAGLVPSGACAAGQRTSQDRPPQKQAPPASYDTAVQGGEGARGDRPSRSPSVTATAGGTTEADAAEREALIRRDRDRPDTAPGVDTDASARSARLRGELQKPSLSAVLASRRQQQQEERRSRRIFGGTRGDDGDDSPCSSDTPPEDPQALLSPNYTQDMAVEEYGRDAATGDMDVDNLATPRGRRAPPGVGTPTPRRTRPTVPPPSLPYDPSEVPSAGVDDASVSYTRDLERQELQDMASELAALLPSPGRGPRAVAEKEPSFSMDPGSGRSPGASAAVAMAAAVAALDRSAAAAGLASWLAAAAASTRHRSAGAAAVAAAAMSAAAGGFSPGRRPIGVAESLLLTLGSPRDADASTEIRWRIGVEQTATGTVPQPLLAASTGGADDSGGIAMPTSATSPPCVFASPSSSSPSVSGAASRAAAMPNNASTAVPEWLAAAAAARRQSPPGPAQSRNGAPPPTRSTTPPSADVGTAVATPSKNAALAQLLASLRPIGSTSAAAAAATAAAGSAPDPSGAAASPRNSGTGSGPAATLLAALTRAQTRPQSALHQQPQSQPQQRRQRRQQEEGAGDEGAARASGDFRLGSSSEPDPELRRLLLSAWGRWYLRRRAGGRNRARGAVAAGRLGDSDEGAAMAAAQARLQTLSAAQRAQAGLQAWDTIGSSPEMQEAANFSRLYIAFTRWLGQARSSRRRSPKAAAAAAAVRGWVEPRPQTTHNALPLAGATNIMPPYPTASPGPGPAPANAPASPALRTRAAATTAPQPFALQLHGAAAAVTSTPTHGTRPTSPSGTTAARARIASAAAQGPLGHVPSPRKALAAPPVATTWPASLRTVLSPPPAARASYAMLYTSPAPSNPAVAPGAATAAVIAATNPGGLLASFGAGAHSTPTISRTSGVRQVTSQPPHRQPHAPQPEPHVASGVAWPSALSQRDHRPHSTAPQRPSSQPRQPTKQPSPAAGAPTSLLVAAAAAPLAHPPPPPAANAPAAPTSELSRASIAAGTGDLESLIALQLLEGLGSGSDGVILAGLRLATGGVFVPPQSPGAAAVQHGGTAHPRPSSTGRLGVQRQLGLDSTGNSGGFSSGAGAGVGGGGGASILSRPLAVQQHQPQYLGFGSGGGLLTRASASPRPGGASALGGLAAGGGGGSSAQGGVSYAGLSRPTSPVRVGSGQVHSLRPQSPIRMAGVNDNIRAAPPGSGHLNLSYYGIRP